MRDWVNKAGYPLLNVSADGLNVKITQVPIYKDQTLAKLQNFREDFCPAENPAQMNNGIYR